MATEAQIAANRTNAQASTGPVTPDGKARASRNATSFGLFSKGDFVLPGEHEIYAEFRQQFEADLKPEGPMEHTLAAEIVHAAWRLRRCSAVEENLATGDPNQPDPILDQTQKSIDRARAEAHRVFHRCTRELTRIQSERRVERLRTAFTNRSQSAPQVIHRPAAPQPLQVPRNAFCPCGSGDKYKRCCGKNAPPVLHNAA